MNDSAKIGLAIAGGYVLGRTKKGKAALGLALWMASSRLGIRPGQLAREGLTKLAATPQIAALGSQLRGPVAQAGRRAAVATLESRMERFADSLQERTSSLSGRVKESASSLRGADDGSDEPDDEPNEEKPTRKSTAKRSSSKRGSSGGTSTATKKRTNTSRSGGRKAASRGSGSGRTSRQSSSRRAS
jgi:hypothetical protein